MKLLGSGLKRSSETERRRDTLETSVLGGGLIAAVGALHQVTLLILYSVFVAKALLEFNPQWDYLAYHLPDALAWFNLTTYQPEPFLQRINAAWPPLAHIVQGALVYLTGRISTANGASAVLFLMIVIALKNLLGELISWRWFLTTLLAVPLFLFHLVSGYTDLFANLWVLLAWGAILSLETQRLPTKAEAALVALCVGTVGAALTKLQMWPVVAVIVLYSVVRLPKLCRGGVISRRATGVALVIIIAFAVAWPVRNIVVYHNPTYPVRFPLAPELFRNYSRIESSERDMPAYLQKSSAPVAFFHSVFELNRLKSAEPYRWWLDQSAEGAEQSPHHRMGGWFFGTVLLMLVGWAVTVRRRLLPLSPTAVFAALCVITAWIPQSHELRYWLYIPLISAVALGRVLVADSKRLLWLKLLLLLSAGYVVRSTDLLSLDMRAAGAYAPAEAVAFWEQQRANGGGAPVAVCGKMPNTIFWAGPTLKEFSVRACTEKP